jgi:hypothetical protein
MCIQLIKHLAMEFVVEVYLSTFLASVVDGSEWSASHLDCITADRILRKRLGGPQSQSGHVEKRKFSCPC